MTESYLLLWEKRYKKLCQLHWRPRRCKHHRQSPWSLWHTARPCCFWSWYHICPRRGSHCCPCTRRRSEVESRTRGPRSLRSYPLNPPWTPKASWWSLEELCALLVGKKIRTKIMPCSGIGRLRFQFKSSGHWAFTTASGKQSGTAHETTYKQHKSKEILNIRDSDQKSPVYEKDHYLTTTALVSGISQSLVNPYFKTYKMQSQPLKTP